MSRSPALYPEERNFFQLLTETVYANPFGIDHARIDRLSGNRSAGTHISQADRYPEILPRLDARLRDLQRRGLGRWDQVPQGDQPLMRQVFLFYGYQRHLADFDRLIAAQFADRKALGFPTGMTLAEELASYGFTSEEADRFITLYYQLRRAHYFIGQALVGSSAPMRALRKALWNSLFTRDLRTYVLSLWNRLEDFSTLLLGETGTGKGSAAAAIGRSAPIAYERGTGRFIRGLNESFIAINLAQFPEGLIESELFGHRKGAFTGAVDHHAGLFSRCPAQGILFLDEIGDVRLPIQTKLLNVLQERRFTPVGSHRVQRFHGRVIAATNRSLDRLLGEGQFRSDLFYRLSSNIIRVPPLRERLADRPEELGELVNTLLIRMAGESPAKSLQGPVLEALASLPRGYAWPGNVRELEQAVRRILLNGSYTPDPLPPGKGADPWLARLQEGRLNAGQLLGGYCRRLYHRLGTYEAVAQVMGWDRRTVKKYLERGG